MVCGHGCRVCTASVVCSSSTLCSQLLWLLRVLRDALVEGGDAPKPLLLSGTGDAMVMMRIRGTWWEAMEGATMKKVDESQHDMPCAGLQWLYMCYRTRSTHRVWSSARTCLYAHTIPLDLRATMLGCRQRYSRDTLQL